MFQSPLLPGLGSYCQLNATINSSGIYAKLNISKGLVNLTTLCLRLVVDLPPVRSTHQTIVKYLNLLHSYVSHAAILNWNLLVLMLLLSQSVSKHRRQFLR